MDLSLRGGQIAVGSQLEIFGQRDGALQESGGGRQPTA